MKIRLVDSALETFMYSLEVLTIAKVLRTLDLLEEFSYALGLPHSKKIYARLWELRIRGKQEVRILYTFRPLEIVLLHGFLKKTNRIAKREIRVALAKLRMLDPVRDLPR